MTSTVTITWACHDGGYDATADVEYGLLPSGEVNWFKATYIHFVTLWFCESKYGMECKVTHEATDAYYDWVAKLNRAMHRDVANVSELIRAEVERELNAA